MQTNRTILATLLITPLLFAGCGSVPERTTRACSSPVCRLPTAPTASRPVPNQTAIGLIFSRKATGPNRSRPSLLRPHRWTAPNWLRKTLLPALEATSLLMRFVDDLEVLYRPSTDWTFARPRGSGTGFRGQPGTGGSPAGQTELIAFTAPGQDWPPVCWQPPGHDLPPADLRRLR